MAVQKLELELVEKKAEAGDVKSFRFAPGDYSFSYKAGQHITMTLDIENCDERGNARKFTLSSSPTESFLQVSTRISQSSFKRTLNSLPVGTKVSLAGPSGVFTLPEGNSAPVVMLAGGIGITPFRSMIKFATDKQLPLKITLLYSNRLPETIAFGEELAGMERKNPNLKVINTVTDSAPGSAWAGETSRVDAGMIKKYVADLGNPIFYVCGPPAMVAAMEDILSGLGIPEERVKSEEFTGY